MSASISLITPTYNRAPYLERLYRSIANGTRLPHEWIVVDDGSTDETAQLLDEIQFRSPFQIRYFYKPNEGQNSAMNLGYSEATGELAMKVDSDDILLPETIVEISRQWQMIAHDNRRNYAGLSGLCVSMSGSILGDSFPTSPLDEDFVKSRILRGIKGDKCEVVRREVIGDNPYPEPGGIRLPGASFLWIRLSRQGYIFRNINIPLKGKDYLVDGLTSQNPRIRRLANRKAFAVLDAELLRYRDLPVLWRMRIITRLIAYLSVFYVDRTVMLNQIRIFVPSRHIDKAIDNQHAAINKFVD